MRRISTGVYLIAGLIALQGCDSNEDDVLSVGGEYAGPITVWYSAVSGALTGQMRLSVVQSGTEITVSGDITLGAITSAMPALTGTINRTGFFSYSGLGLTDSYYDTQCGTVTGTSLTIAFTGDTMRYQEAGSSTSCGTYDVSATLRRTGD